METLTSYSNLIYLWGRKGWKESSGDTTDWLTLSILPYNLLCLRIQKQMLKGKWKCCVGELPLGVVDQKTQYTIFADRLSIFCSLKNAKNDSKSSFEFSAVTLCRKKSFPKKNFIRPQDKKFIFCPDSGKKSLGIFLDCRVSEHVFKHRTFYVWSFWLKRNWPSDIRYALRTFKLKTRGQKSKCHFLFMKKTKNYLNLIQVFTIFCSFSKNEIVQTDFFLWRVKCSKILRYWTTDADPRWFWPMVRVASSIEDPMLSAAPQWFLLLHNIIEKFICLFNSFFRLNN